jgi:hypothetical protein
LCRPQHVLKREIKRFKYACIQTGTAIGELDHPSYSSQFFRHLNLGNASHQVRARGCEAGVAARGMPPCGQPGRPGWLAGVHAPMPP